MTLPAGMADTYLHSDYYYAARGRALTIEVASVATSGDHGFWFDIGGPTDYADIGVSENQLRVGRSIGGNRVPVATPVPYDPTAHRFWRLRDDGAAIHYEVSADGVTFDELATAASPFVDVDYALATIWGYGEDAVDGSELRVASIRADTVAGHCPVDTFTEDFEDGVLDTHFGLGYASAGCQRAVVGGELHFDVPANASGESCRAESGSGYDLTDSAVSLEVLSPGKEGRVLLRGARRRRLCGVGGQRRRATSRRRSSTAPH